MAAGPLREGGRGRESACACVGECVAEREKEKGGKQEGHARLLLSFVRNLLILSLYAPLTVLCLIRPVCQAHGQCICCLRSLVQWRILSCGENFPSFFLLFVCDALSGRISRPFCFALRTRYRQSEVTQAASGKEGV